MPINIQKKRLFVHVGSGFHLSSYGLSLKKKELLCWSRKLDLLRPAHFVHFSVMVRFIDIDGYVTPTQLEALLFQ